MRSKELEVKIAHEERELERWNKELESLITDLAPIVDVVFDENAYKDVVSTLKRLEVVYREGVINNRFGAYCGCGV
jgi:hypothetical protein